MLDALDFATKAHAGQRRKGLDEPYILHPLRVALMAYHVGLDGYAVEAGLLHDVVEDCKVSFGDLEAAGFAPRTRELVGLLTKWWGDSGDPTIAELAKPLYYGNIAADPDATALKVIDRTDNLKDLTRALPDKDAKFRRWGARYLEKTDAEFPLLLGRSLPVPLRLWFLDARGDLRNALGLAPPCYQID